MNNVRFALGVAAGLLLAVGIIASGGFAAGNSPGVNLSLFHSKGIANETVQNTVTSANPNSTDHYFFAGSSPSLAAFGTADSPSHVNKLVVQPVEVSGIVLLPILAALLIGLVLYRTSSNRAEGSKSN